jgi:hypothetical protein
MLLGDVRNKRSQATKGEEEKRWIRQHSSTSSRPKRHQLFLLEHRSGWEDVVREEQPQAMGVVQEDLKREVRVSSELPLLGSVRKHRHRRCAGQS